MEVVRVSVVSLRKIESQVEDQNPSHFGSPVEEPPVPQLAEGTRKDIHVQSTKGLRIATRCQTVESFVAAYHPICEDTAIFIPNTRRSLGAITQFTFTLADGNPVLKGIGAVTEEFTTAENRFGHAGIVISLQQLARGSTGIFDRLLAGRTVPATIAAKVQIPNPVDRHDRAKTVIGITAISKPPSITIKVPTTIAPQVKKNDAKRRVQAKATPASDLDSNWDVIAGSGDAIPVPIEEPSDTIRDVMPYALHDALGNAAPVPVQTPDGFETVTAVGTEVEIQVFRALSDIGRAPAMAVAPVETIEVVIADEPAISEPTPSPPQIVESVFPIAKRSTRPWRWVAAFATLVLLLVATATVTVLVEPATSMRQGIESAPMRTDSRLKLALMAEQTPPQPTQAEPASESPVRTAKAAPAPAPKVRPRPRAVRRVVKKPKCRSLDCL